MYARPQASHEVRSGRSLRFWWLLALCLLVVAAGGASAAFAADNTAPIARDNSYRVHRGNTLERPVPGVLNNDIDPEGDRLSAARASSPRHGKLLLRSNGSFVYKPNERFRGIDSFTYTASDGNGGADTALVEITVWPVSVPPLARNDAYRVDEDETLTVSSPGVLRNDAEVDGRRLFATKISDPTHGSLNLSPNGSFDYIPDGDFNGEDSFIYRAADRTGRGDRATVSISVNSIEDGPGVSVANNGPIDEGGSATITANATDVDTPGSTFTYKFDCDGDNNFEVVLPAGNTTSCSFDDNGDKVVNGHASDGNGGEDTGSTTVTVNNVAPTGTLRNTGPANEGDPVQISFKDTDGRLTVQDPSGADRTAGFKYEYQCDGSFSGDPAPNYASAATDPFASCTFGQNGAKTVAARVLDKDNDATAYTTEVTVNNVKPSVTLSGPSTVDESTTEERTYTFSVTDPGDDTFEVVTPDYPTCGQNGTLADDSLVTDESGGSFECIFPDGDATSNVEVQVRDDDGALDADSIEVTVNNVAPTVDTSNCCTAYTEGQEAPVQIDTGITVTDPGDDNIESATVKITSGHQASDVLDVPSPPSGFTVNHVAGSDTLTITGAKTAAEYEALLRTVTFDSTSTSPGTSRTITFQVNDGDANNPATNDTRDITITNVNDAPVISNVTGTVAYAENDPASHLDNDAVVSDNDSPNLTGGTVKVTDDTFRAQDELTFTDEGPVTGTYNDTSGVLKISGTGTLAQYQAFIRGVGFRTTDDTPETHDRMIELQVSDGEPSNGDSNVATKTVTVTETNDQPVVDTTDGASSYIEDASATVVDNGVTVTDVDDTNLASASVVISNFQTDDVLGFTDTAEIDGSYASGTLTLLPQPGQTPDVADFQSALRSVSYSNSSQSPNTTARTINFSVNDGDVNSTSGSKTMNVVGVNDAPVLNQPEGTLTYTEDDPSENHAADVAPNLTVADVDDTNLASGTVEITTNVQSPQDELLFTNQNGISATGSGTGSLTLTGSATKANWQTALRSVQYRNTSDAPNTSQRTVSFRVSDGHTGENPDSNIVTRDIEVVPTNDAPTADNETFNGTSRAIGNTSLVINETTDVAPDPTGPQKTVTGDILDGDADVDGPNTLAITGAGTDGSNGQTTGGGQITVQPDGDFIYQPEPGCADTTDTFKYTVSDGHSPTAGTAQGTVTVNIADCVWYVDDSATGGGDGRSHLPYNSLDSIDGAGGSGDADSAGDKIFLYDGTYSGGLPLETNQALFTEKHGLVVGDGGSGNVTLEPSDGSGSTLNGGLAAASGNNVQGLSLGTTGSSSVYALSGPSVGTFTMNNVTGGDLNNPAGGAINITGTGNALNLQFGTLSSSGSSGSAVSILNASGTVTGQSGTLSNATGTTVNLNSGSLNFTYNGAVSDDSGQLISIANKSSGTTDFNGPVDDATANPNNGGGISLQSNGTALTRFDGGLNLSTGSSNGFVATSGGTLALPDPASASNSIVSTTGTPLNISSTTIHGDDLVFEKISSNGSTNGIVLNNTGTSGNLSVTGNGGVCTIATPTCSGGTIQSTTGDGVSLTNTSSPSFQLMRVLNTAGHGISGTTTSGLSLSNSLIQGAGDADNEAGLFFANVNGTNLTGNSSITNTVVNAPADVGAFIQNYGGTLNLTVSGSTFSGTQKNTPGVVTGDDLMRLVADGSPATITASFTGNTFDRSESDGIAISAVSSTGSGGGTLNLTADTNTFTGDNGGSTCPNGCNDNAIQAQATQDGTMRLTIQNNNIQNQRNEAIAVVSDNTADVQGTIQNNTIGTAATPGSGSLFAQGILLAPDDNADLVARVHNNIIRQTFFQGIWAEANDGTGGTPTMDVIMTNNTTPTPADTGGTVLGSIEVWSTTKAITCAKVENNTAATGVSGGESIALFQQDTATFKIEGLPTPTSNASAYVAGKNPASASPINAIALGAGSTFTGGTCRTPAATPMP